MVRLQLYVFEGAKPMEHLFFVQKIKARELLRAIGDSNCETKSCKKVTKKFF